MGGFVAVTPATVQDNIRFAECSFVAGLALTGTGTGTFEDEAVVWTVTFDDGELNYEASDEGSRVSGTWQGQPVDLAG